MTLQYGCSGKRDSWRGARDTAFVPVIALRCCAATPRRSQPLVREKGAHELPIPEHIALADIASLVGELTMRLRWDTVGKKPKELLEKFAVPLRRKTLIFFDRGSPPLRTTTKKRA